jgi:hypothetical protein
LLDEDHDNYNDYDDDDDDDDLRTLDEARYHLLP